MRKPFRKVLIVAVTVALLLCIAVAGLWRVAAPSNPMASINYIRAIDGNGHWRLQFGITNVGDCTLFASTFGDIEVFGQTNFSVSATAPISRLNPNQGHVVEVVLSEAQMERVRGKWRYACFLGPGGLRSAIYRWQWGPNGPGARVNWLIPQRLKGMPLTVKATGDWIEDPK